MLLVKVVLFELVDAFVHYVQPYHSICCILSQLHFLRRTVRAWARVSRVLKEEMVLKIREVPRIVQWWHLTRWRELCETRWRRYAGP
jgi:hypothetical protein